MTFEEAKHLALAERVDLLEQQQQMLYDYITKVWATVELMIEQANTVNSFIFGVPAIIPDREKK